MKAARNQARFTESSDPGMVWTPIPRQHPIANIAHTAPLNLTRRPHPLAVAEQQQPHHHLRRIPNTAAAVAPVSGLEPRQVELIHRIQDKKGQMTRI
jgi:hypothetical protein